VGGIPEVVDNGVTGLLVDYSPDAAAAFEAGLADAVNTLTRDPARAQTMGVAGRQRALADFSWQTIAGRTVELYQSVLGDVRSLNAP
jgi:starch synthase